MPKRFVAVFALAVLASATFVGTASARKFNAGSQSVPCGGDQTISTVEKIRNRNHKLRSVTLVLSDPENDGDTIGLTVDAVTHEEEGFEKGATRRHEPDFVNAAPNGTAVDDGVDDSAAVTLQLRGERLAKPKDGRTYDLTVTCTDSEGGIPTSETVHVFVRVPHSNR